MAKKSGLGKGLDALFLDNIPEASMGAGRTLRLSQIEPNKDQPRREFNAEALGELADSIREHGVIQPIVVRPLEDDTYQIVAGERRWRAARLAGLTEVPVVIRELDDLATMELALIENLQREDLNPVEEAEGYRVLMSLYNMTQEQVSRRVGKSRPVVANALRLLSLPSKALNLVKEGKLSPGHAKILAGLERSQDIDLLAGRIVEEGLTVRRAEQLAKELREGSPPQKAPAPRSPGWGNHEYKEVELALQEQIGRRVKITATGEGGKLEMEFFSKEDLLHLSYLLGEHAQTQTKS